MRNSGEAGTPTFERIIIARSEDLVVNAAGGVCSRFSQLCRVNSAYRRHDSIESTHPWQTVIAMLPRESSLAGASFCYRKRATPRSEAKS
jgi:hypothetical protein